MKFLGWQQNNHRSWIRSIDIINKDTFRWTPHIQVYQKLSSYSTYIYFDQLLDLNKLYCQLSKYPNYATGCDILTNFNDIEKTKQHVDDFLIKAEKLLPFI